MVIETAKMSERGQVIIPKEVREAVGASTDTIFAFGTINKDTIVMKKLDTKSLIEEFRKLRPKAYNLIKKIAESLMKQSLLKVDESASLDEMFYEYRKYMEAEMPSKRVADRYIFIKK